MADKIFAVIDTNVVVSALIAKNLETPPLMVMAHVYSGTITPIYNDEIFKEYQEVLSRDRFHLPTDRVESALSVIRDYGLNLERTKVEGETFTDPKDVVFYEVKMSKDDAFLVTGNSRHFPKKPFVVTPAEMIAIIEGESK
jgi:putative PIN family toxin of toxin-antitoxin system